MLNEIQNTQNFWTIIDKMIEHHKIIIDRAKGTAHPKWGWIYESDYGYLENTSSSDGEGIDVWIGTKQPQIADAIICIVDASHNDSEIKILIGCTDEETEKIYALHNKFDSMKGILIKR